MKHQRPHIYFLTCLLSLLLATSGLAQGLDICKGKYCEAAQKAKQKVVLPKKLAHEIPLDVGLPLCKLHNFELDATIEIPAPEKNDNDALPICCHLKKAGQKAQAITSTSHSWSTDRSIVVLQPILSDYDLMNGHRDPAIADYAIHSRAAPAPLYLINASFIC